MSTSPAAAGVQPDWERIPSEEWSLYREVIHRARDQNIPFAFGGAFASAVYTGELRNTKDFDFYLRPVDRDRMIRVMTEAGLTDHFERLPYDRSWIYRASRGDVLVDAIWAMANHRTEVDDGWLTRGPEINMRGERLRAIPVEELIWSKLYVLQRERCDWTDVFNLLDARLEAIDWNHLLNRLEEDLPLLSGAAMVFAWLAPDRLEAIPPEVRGRLCLPDITASDPPQLSRVRAQLLDSRPWFIRHMR
jgi:hypothetical protein